MKVSGYFKLGRRQATLDFLDVYINKDLPVFIDPGAIRALGTQWGSACSSLLQNYFEVVLDSIQAGKHQRAKDLLSCLNERNEFHLGFTKNGSHGHALGPVSASKIWDSLAKSKAAKTGLLQDLEDTVLFVEGIGPDMLSDAICNIIRGPLIEYTQAACAYYGIPLTQGLNSGPVWNPKHERWETALVALPKTKHGPLILVPKVLVRVKPTIEPGEYYRHYLMPYLQDHEKGLNSNLVITLKTGKNKGLKKVTKKSLYEKYGADKLAAADATILFPEAFTKYKTAKKADPKKPLDHVPLAEIENDPAPDFAALLKAVTSLPAGTKHATAYEDAIEQLMSALFYPALSFPSKQHEIHGGRKRIDITYSNTAQEGFFWWLANHYSAAHVVIECKNYAADVANPELDQLSSRFSPSRGRFGILIVRTLANKQLFLKRCRDTANDDRGFILVLEDNDLPLLVSQRYSILKMAGNNMLRAQFQSLID